MSRREEVLIQIIAVLIIGILIVVVVDMLKHKGLNLSEIEHAKLEAGEPVQVEGWYEDEFGHHAIYARLVGDKVIFYGVVKEAE